MPSLDSCNVGKGFPKAGEKRNVYLAGFEFVPVKNGEKVLLKGYFIDEEGQEFNTAFGYTTGLALDKINELLIALDKDPVDEVSMQSLSLPDKGAVPSDWAAPVDCSFIEDPKDKRYVRMGNITHI